MMTENQLRQQQIQTSAAQQADIQAQAQERQRDVADSKYLQNKLYDPDFQKAFGTGDTDAITKHLAGQVQPKTLTNTIEESQKLIKNKQDRQTSKNSLVKSQVEAEDAANKSLMSALDPESLGKFSDEDAANIASAAVSRLSRQYGDVLGPDFASKITPHGGWNAGNVREWAPKIVALSGMGALAFDEAQRRSKEAAETADKLRSANAPYVVGPGAAALPANTATAAPATAASAASPVDSGIPISRGGPQPATAPAPQATPIFTNPPAATQAANAPLGDRLDLLNASLAHHYLATHPQEKSVPAAFQLPKSATQGDFEAVNKTLEDEVQKQIERGHLSVAQANLARENKKFDLEYGPDAVQTLGHNILANPDAITPTSLGALKVPVMKWLNSQGYNEPKPADANARATELAANNALSSTDFIRKAIQNPEVSSRLGPILGNLGKVEQKVGTAVGLSPEAETAAQELRTRMRYFVFQEGKALLSGRLPQNLMKELETSSADVHMDAPTLLGALNGAKDSAVTNLDNIDKQRFGGKARPRTVRGLPPGDARQNKATGHILASDDGWKTSYDPQTGEYVK